jgi:hypothetical protein
MIARMILLEAQGRALITRAENAALKTHDGLAEAAMVAETGQMTLRLRQLRAIIDLTEVLVADIEAQMQRLEHRIARIGAKP